MALERAASAPARPVPRLIDLDAVLEKRMTRSGGASQRKGQPSDRPDRDESTTRSARRSRVAHRHGNGRGSCRGPGMSPRTGSVHEAWASRCSGPGWMTTSLRDLDAFVASWSRAASRFRRPQPRGAPTCRPRPRWCAILLVTNDGLTPQGRHIAGEWWNADDGGRPRVGHPRHSRWPLALRRTGFRRPRAPRGRPEVATIVRRALDERACGATASLSATGRGNGSRPSKRSPGHKRAAERRLSEMLAAKRAGGRMTS